MRFKYRFLCFSALILAVAGARADNPETQKRAEALRAAHAFPSDAVNRGAEAQRLSKSPRAAPVFALGTPRVDVGALRLRQGQRAAPAFASATPRPDVESLRRSHRTTRTPPVFLSATRNLNNEQNARAVPASPSVALRTDLEVFKKRAAAPATSNGPSVDVEKLRQPNTTRLTKTAASSSLEEETRRVSQAAIEAIPLQRASNSGGSSIPPIRSLTPAGRL